jgi:hypothetical protein
MAFLGGGTTVYQIPPARGLHLELSAFTSNESPLSILHRRRFPPFEVCQYFVMDLGFGYGGPSNNKASTSVRASVLCRNGLSDGDTSCYRKAFGQAVRPF